MSAVATEGHCPQDRRARPAFSIMEGILLDCMYELPGLESVEEIVVNGEVVEGRATAAVRLFRRGKGPGRNRLIRFADPALCPGAWSGAGLD